MSAYPHARYGWLTDCGTLFDYEYVFFFRQIFLFYVIFGPKIKFSVKKKACGQKFKF
jgi:hypothetical protein